MPKNTFNKLPQGESNIATEITDYLSEKDIASLTVTGRKKGLPQCTRDLIAFKALDHVRREEFRQVPEILNRMLDDHEPDDNPSLS